VNPVHKIWLLDVLDILLVAVLFYRLLVGVKGTRSAQMFVGLLVLVVVSGLARLLGLIAVDYIATNLRTVWLITFVILFQPELRHALAQFGRTRYFRSFLRVDEYGVLGEVVRAAESLSSNRHGGLIVMERNEGLRNFVETGTRLDARVKSALVETLFTPNSPLHDGAVIIRGDQVVAAGCILPLSQNPRLSPQLRAQRSPCRDPAPCAPRRYGCPCCWTWSSQPCRALLPSFRSERPVRRSSGRPATDSRSRPDRSTHTARQRLRTVASCLS